MSAKITFIVNRSSSSEIAAHLLRTDAAFEPVLSSRVDIRTYAQKLYHRAVRFEAWLGEELVGLVASYCNELDKGKAFVTSVSVLPECQGQGIAGRLLRQCIEHVRNLGFSQLQLEVNFCCLTAVALYQKHGFKTLRSRGSTLTMGMSLVK
jgi:ribosomal protein S18 acetylase RimI-like enzyme